MSHAISPIGPLLPSGSSQPSVSVSASTSKNTAESPGVSSGIAEKIFSGTSASAAIVPSMQPLDLHALSQTVASELAVSAEDIAQATDVADSLQKSSSATVVSMQAYIEKNSSEIISKLVENLQAQPSGMLEKPKKAFGVTHGAMNTFLSSLAFVSGQVSGSISFAQLQMEDDKFGSSALHGLKGVQVGTALLKLLGAGGSAVVIQSLINQAKKAIELKRALIQRASGDEKLALERDIKLLDEWVKLHQQSLAEQVKNTVLSTVLSFPKIGSGICALLQKGSTTAGQFLSGMAVGFGVVGSSWEWYKIKKALHRHKKWAKGLLNSGLTSQDAKQLVDKQRRMLEARMKKNEPLLQSTLQPLIDQLNGAAALATEPAQALLKDVLAQLCAKGFDIAPEPHSAKSHHNAPAMDLMKARSPIELRDWLLTPQVKLELNRQMMQKNEALSVSLRNALKTFVVKKAAIERGFLEWELLKARINTGAVVVMASLWIALKVAIIPAIIGGAVTGLVVSGYGMLALGIVLLVVGLAYLYYKKPNVFKTMCKGVYVELVLRKIPLAIQQYRRQAALLDILALAERAQSVGDRLLAVEKLQAQKDSFVSMEELPDELRAYVSKKNGVHDLSERAAINKWIEEYRLWLKAELKRQEEEIDALNSRVLGLNEFVEAQEKKVAALQEQVRTAGWQDYQRLLRPHMPALAEDDSSVLANFLLADETILQDPDISSILAQMDINLAAVRHAPKDRAVQQVAQGLQSYFAMDEAEFTAALTAYKRKRKLKIVS